MKNWTKWIWSSLLIATVALATGKIQNEDVKTLTELQAAGGTTAQLINDTKIYVTANNVNTQLSTAIANGVIGGGGGNGTNYLSNSSFENGNASWTNTNSTPTTDSTNYTDLTHSELMTLSSQLGNIYQDVTPTTQLSGVNMQAICYIKTALTGVQLCGRVGGVTQSCVTVPSNNQWSPVTSSFGGPTSGSIGLQVWTTGVTTGTFNVDQCYLGKQVNLGAGYMATDWTPYTMTVGATTTPPTKGTIVSDQALWRRVGDHMEIKWNYQATSGGSAGSGAYLFPLPSGYTIDTTKATVATQLGTTSGQLTAGGNVVGTGLMYNALTSATVTQWETWVTIYNSTNLAMNHISATNTQLTAVQSGDTISFATNPLYLSFFASVPIVGWTSSQAAYRADVTPANWSGYQTVSSGCSTTSATYADPSACTGIALTQLVNRNFGTVTTAGSSLPGITFTPPRQGNYLICAHVQLSTTLIATDSVRLTDGTNILNQGKSVTISAAGDGSVTVCGTEPYTGTGAITVKLQLAASTSTAAIVNGVASTSSAIDWDITEKDAPMPAPYLTGSVTSTTTGAEHIERANIANCTSSPCTVTSQSGSWISSVTRTSAGLYVINFTAGEFSAAPTCTNNAYTDTPVSNGNSVPTSSSFTALFRNTSFTPADPTGGFGVVCMGPR